ncbi:MAG: nucleotide exchange factor GrpE, partial [Duodenibacillus sp.]|nr:nucleotide exchange factor GrpE [Duodenibacillus sp.]
GAAPAAADPLELAQLQAANADLAKQLEQANELYLRAKAEMENLRRRCDEEVAKARKFGVEKFAKSLLPVVDSLEKSVEHAAQAEGPLKEGIELTERQLARALENCGMRPVDPAGQKFDPASQQAIAMVPAGAERQPGTVAEVFQRGWMIHERVLRPAMVSVVQG